MAGTICPVPYHQFLTDAGVIAAGYKLYTYVAGSVGTAQATYSDSALAVANANPIVLDSAGRAKIFLPGQSFKFVLKTAADVTVWTIDNVAATPEFDVDLDVTGTAGEALSAGEFVYCSDGSGALTVGRWYLADGDLPYASLGAGAVGVVPADIASAAEGSIRVGGRITGLAGLSAGSIYYLSGTAGGITTTAPACPRIVGMADSATTLVLFGQDIPRNVLTNLDTEATAVGNVGAGEDNLQTYSLPAATLGVNGTGVRILCWGTTANNANAKTIKLYFGTDSLLTLTPTVSEAGMWMVGAHVMRTGAATQIACAAGQCGPTNTTVTATSGNVSSPTQTLANAVTIKCTGEATANDDITQEGMVVRLS